MLQKYLKKNFMYRFVRHGKVSHTIDDATEALDTAWEIFQVRSTVYLDMVCRSKIAAASVLVQRPSLASGQHEQTWAEPSEASHI